MIRMNGKKKILIIGSIVFILFFGWFLSRSYQTPVITVGTQNIFADEWKEFLQQQKSAATVYYTENYGCTTFDNSFWTTEYNGQTPLDYARNRALDELIDGCIVLEEAQKEGLIENIDLRTLKKEWKGFNDQRQSSVSQNGVVYGPVEYSFENYYRHLISNLRNFLGEKLIQEDPEAETRAKNFYHENLDMFTTVGDIHASALLIEGEKDESYRLAQQAKEAIEKGMSFEQACKQYATCGEAQFFEFTSLTQKADLHGLSEVYAACSQLQMGEISEVIETQQGMYLLEITRRDEVQVMEYEEVKNRIRDILAAEYLDAHLQKLRDECVFQVQEQLWESIQMM